jgi:cbb3-type cytochrome oxidase maturation protein
MTALAWLIPAALLLGLLGLAAFLWALNSGQFEDLEGASWRAIQDSDAPDSPPVNESDNTPRTREDD